MKTAASLFAAAVAFAVLTTSAAAKELKSAKVCGPSDCVIVTDRENVSLPVGGEGPGSPPPASYTVEFAVAVGGEPTWTVYYVPSAAKSRPVYEPHGKAGPSLHAWSTLTPAATALFREITRGLQPFPKPDLSSVAIDSRTVVDGADSYLRLFELPRTSGAGGALEYSESIDLRSTQPTPWTDSPSDLSFSPSAGLLARGGQVVRIPNQLLADIRAGRPLAPDDEGAPLAADDDGTPFAWPTLVATLTTALAVAVAIAFLLRRVRRPAPPGLRDSDRGVNPLRR